MSSTRKSIVDAETKALLADGYVLEEFVYNPAADPLCDPELVGILTDLNSLGYVTESSCAGHVNYPYKGVKSDGFISIDQSLDADELFELRSLATRHGLTNVSFDNSIEHDRSSMLFDAIGKDKEV